MILKDYVKELILEALSEDRFHRVLTLHGYKSKAGPGVHSIYRNGEGKAKHHGTYVTTHDHVDGERKHSTPSKLNSYLNKLHDSEISLKK